ncbi:MAG: replication protein [Chloroflexi bacterium]|nr:replication protein [Chloroflexota bacterium]
MKRSIPRSLIDKALQAQQEAAEGREGSVETDTGSATDSPSVPKPFQRPSAGAGSAWKAGALAQTQASLEQNRAQIVQDILSGRLELAINPSQISDPLGTDRRADWIEQDAFRTLLKSIEANGQDTPILVWPKDEAWVPDPLNPTDVEGVEFIMLTGRRRLAVAEKLELPLRAVLAPSEKRGSVAGKFEMLFFRFRENEERENLSPFERLLSIGEMFETLNATKEGQKLTAVAFAERVGVHESIISRARAVFRSRDAILNAFKNVYEMSFRDLQSALATVSGEKQASLKAKPKPKKLMVTRKVGNKKISITSIDGKLSVSAAGLKIDKKGLEGLGDLIADYLQKHRSDNEA